MTSISVVVAAPARYGLTAAASAEALATELRPGDEVIWVGRPVPAVGGPALWATINSPSASRGELSGLGLAAVSPAAEVVAFTDSASAVASGWRAGILVGLQAGARCVGGPVVPGPIVSAVDWAGFLVEYGPHGAAPYLSATGEVAANNVAYRAEVLEPWRGRPVWKTEVSKQLAAEGSRPAVIAEMAVSVHKTHRRRSFLASRRRPGTQYAALQRAGQGWGTRLLRAAGCLVLPWVAYRRLRTAVARDARLRAELRRSRAWVLAGLAAWSFGEALGWLGAGAPEDVM